MSNKITNEDIISYLDKECEESLRLKIDEAIKNEIHSIVLKQPLGFSPPSARELQRWFDDRLTSCGSRR